MASRISCAAVWYNMRRTIYRGNQDGDYAIIKRVPINEKNNAYISRSQELFTTERESIRGARDAIAIVERARAEYNAGNRGRSFDTKPNGNIGDVGLGLRQSEGERVGDNGDGGRNVESSSFGRVLKLRSSKGLVVVAMMLIADVFDIIRPITI